MAKDTRRPRRVRGEGSIYQAADGRWRAAIVLVDPLTGERFRRTVSGRTAADARTKLDAIRSEGAGGLASNRTTAEYLIPWAQRVQARLRPSTALSYEQHVRTFWVPAIGTIPLARLAPADVERVMAAMVQRGYSARTAASARSTLRRALHDAIRDSLLVRNVASLAHPPRLERTEIRPMPLDEARALLAATADDDLWGPFFALALATGLRSGELRGLAWADIDPARRTLTVRAALRRGYGRSELVRAEPKTRRSRRTIALPAQTTDALERRRVAQNADRASTGPDWEDMDGLVFTDAIGRPLPGYAASNAWNAALRAAGLPHYRLHDARHTAASLMLAAGVPLRTISETLGHSTLAITADVYAHLGDELRRDAADAMERVLR